MPDERGAGVLCRSKYLNVLDFVFGNEGLHNGTIKHVPSNQDILDSLGKNYWVQFLKRLLWGKRCELRQGNCD